jgi:small subunit ribosomal protein S20
MPHHKSCKKRLKTSEKSRVYNRSYRSSLRNNIKAFRALESREEASAMVPTLSSQLDRMAKKGILKKRMVDRIKSRLALRVNRMS